MSASPTSAGRVDLGAEPHLFRAPVVILAGGADREGSASIEAARRLYLACFSGFTGTLVSGGTLSGVAGLAGELTAAYPQITSIGYIPERLPASARRDERYSRFRTSPTDTFTVAEPMQSWADMLLSGVDPRSVSLLGWGGGAIAAQEYRVALALGARVGLVEGSGRSAGDLLADPAWAGSPNLYRLPAVAAALRAFILPELRDRGGKPT